MRCGKPVQKEEQEYCRDCLKHPASYEQGRSLWLHRSPVSAAIYKFKYQNKRNYGKIFAKEMAAVYGKQILSWGIDEIIPIPLHKKRMRKRGYNQAGILAEGLGRYLDIPVNQKALYRIRNTRPQKQLNDSQRISNLKGAFAVSKQYQAKSNILLVDDIYTTGNTIHRAAKMLKKAGVKKVYFLTISIGQGL